MTGGPFFFFRHPNYTFEVLGWLLSFAAAISAAAPVSRSTCPRWRAVPWAPSASSASSRAGRPPALREEAA